MLSWAGPPASPEHNGCQRRHSDRGHRRGDRRAQGQRGGHHFRQQSDDLDDVVRDPAGSLVIVAQGSLQHHVGRSFPRPGGCEPQPSVVAVCRATVDLCRVSWDADPDTAGRGLRGRLFGLRGDATGGGPGWR